MATDRENRMQGFRLARDVLDASLSALAAAGVPWNPSRKGSILSAFEQHGYAKGDPYAAFAEVEAHGLTFHIEVREVLR